ncbi:hypothetical protein LQG66_26135 [Bradyrhizobium ontarionense]|uniref:Uncharacterized protein n=1 Tax=Bradyrhizobium ontarionense TaxID=2898149 RepID=A0ABY3R5Y0_9BRAD|nr:hypothetical protein [Bradyrhizobium sp. A19]UFZ02731.1 hypothetical protein LQG66_26135 [Bradyrhizobium sp. A19]
MSHRLRDAFPDEARKRPGTSNAQTSMRAKFTRDPLVRQCLTILILKNSFQIQSSRIFAPATRAECRARATDVVEKSRQELSFEQDQFDNCGPRALSACAGIHQRATPVPTNLRQQLAADAPITLDDLQQRGAADVSRCLSGGFRREA